MTQAQRIVKQSEIRKFVTIKLGVKTAILGDVGKLFILKPIVRAYMSHRALMDLILIQILLLKRSVLFGFHCTVLANFG